VTTDFETASKRRLNSPSCKHWLRPIGRSASYRITRRAMTDARRDCVSNGGTSWLGSDYTRNFTPDCHAAGAQYPALQSAPIWPKAGLYIRVMRVASAISRHGRFTLSNCRNVAVPRTT
jgi:hypothetical protein